MKTGKAASTTRKARSDLSRRDFLKIAGVGGFAAGALGPSFLFPERAHAQQKTRVIA